MTEGKNIKIIAVNRRALHHYEILEKIEAGLSLMGSEVKSLREGRVNFLDSFVRIEGAEAFLYNLHISSYSAASYLGHEPTRRRKLLLHKQEIRRLAAKQWERGLTIIPLRLYFSDHILKAEIALVRGKREFDKREAIKKEEQRKAMAEALKAKLRKAP